MRWETWSRRRTGTGTPLRTASSEPSPNALFSPLFSARLRETERQKLSWEVGGDGDGERADKVFMICRWDDEVQVPLAGRVSPRGLRWTRVESSIRLLTLHASCFFDQAKRISRSRDMLFNMFSLSFIILSYWRRDEWPWHPVFNYLRRVSVDLEDRLLSGLSHPSTVYLLPYFV